MRDIEEKEGRQKRVPIYKSQAGTLLLTSSLFLLFVSFGTGFYLGEDVFKKPNVEKQLTDVTSDTIVSFGTANTVTNYDVTDSKILSLIDNLNKGVGCETNFGTYVNDGFVTADDVPGKVAASVLYGNDDLRDGMTLDEAAEEVKKYFGKNYELKLDSDFNLGCDFKYESATAKFIKVGESCGCNVSLEHTRYRITRAVEKGDLFEIDVRVAFYKDGKFYRNFAKTSEINEIVLNNGHILESDKGYTNAAHYLFTFRLEDGNHVFVSAEPVR